MDVEKMADALTALINSSPYSPRKDEIVDVLKAAMAPAADGPKILVSGCALGANIVVVEDSRIQVNGWHVGVRQGHTADADEVVLSILDFLREAILSKRAKPAGILH